MSAGDAVLERLRAAGVRPADLARALNVTPQLAGMMLNGKRGIPTWHLDAVAELLGTSVPDLFRRDLPGHANGLDLASKPSKPTVGEDGRTHAQADARILAEELRSIADAFQSAIQDVAGRLTERLANASDADTDHKTRHSKTNRVRGHRKNG